MVVENTRTTGTYDARIEQHQAEALTPAPNQTTAAAAATNSVFGHSGSQQTGGSSPTEGGRETSTESKVPGYAEIEQMVNDRLANDPEYQKLAAKLEKWESIENDFALVDRFSGFITGDGTVTLENLRAVANNDHPDAADARAAAKRLLSDISVWNEISKGDNIAGTHDVMAFVAGMKDGLKALKEAARADIKGEVGAAAAAASGATPANSSTPTSGTEGAQPLFNAPTPSTKPGMEGAVENVNRTLTAIGDAMSELTAQMMDPKLSPEKRQELQARYNELQQLQGMLVAMYKQLQEAVANILKMYSEVAQNSVRNMR